MATALAQSSRLLARLFDVTITTVTRAIEFAVTIFLIAYDLVVAPYLTIQVTRTAMAVRILFTLRSLTA